MAERALVTGGAGFIGSHVVDSLVRDGFEVLVVDDLSAGDATRLAPEAQLAKVDITDNAALTAAFDAFRPQAVFHLAAQASVTASVADPGRDCAVNVLGTLNVVEARAAARRAARLHLDRRRALRRRRRRSRPPRIRWRCRSRPTARRSWPPRPTCAAGRPRTASRTPSCASATSTARARRRTARPGVVAIFSYRLWAGEPCTLYGHGSPTRDYVHVLDVVAALRAASGKNGHLQRRHGRRDRRRDALCAARRGGRLDRRAVARRLA